jgi:hypothetical protein
VQLLRPSASKTAFKEAYVKLTAALIVTKLKLTKVSVTCLFCQREADYSTCCLAIKDSCRILPKVHSYKYMTACAKVTIS